MNFEHFSAKSQCIKKSSAVIKFHLSNAQFRINLHYENKYDNEAYTCTHKFNLKTL